MKAEYSVYPIGSRVDIDIGNEQYIRAIIIGMKIFDNGISYVVTYWKDQDKIIIDVESCEISVSSNDRQKIGFIIK